MSKQRDVHDRRAAIAHRIHDEIAIPRAAQRAQALAAGTSDGLGAHATAYQHHVLEWCRGAQLDEHAAVAVLICALAPPEALNEQMQQLLSSAQAAASSRLEEGREEPLTEIVRRHLIAYESLPTDGNSTTRRRSKTRPEIVISEPSPWLRAAGTYLPLALSDDEDQRAKARVALYAASELRTAFAEEESRMVSMLGADLTLIEQLLLWSPRRRGLTEQQLAIARDQLARLAAAMAIDPSARALLPDDLDKLLGDEATWSAVISGQLSGAPSERAAKTLEAYFLARGPLEHVIDVNRTLLEVLLICTQVPSLEELHAGGDRDIVLGVTPACLERWVEDASTGPVPPIRINDEHIAAICSAGPVQTTLIAHDPQQTIPSTTLAASAGQQAKRTLQLMAGVDLQLPHLFAGPVDGTRALAPLRDRSITEYMQRQEAALAPCTHRQRRYTPDEQLHRLVEDCEQCGRRSVRVAPIYELDVETMYAHAPRAWYSDERAAIQRELAVATLSGDASAVQRLQTASSFEEARTPVTRPRKRRIRA